MAVTSSGRGVRRHTVTNEGQFQLDNAVSPGKCSQTSSLSFTTTTHMPCLPNETRYNRIRRCWPRGPALAISYAPGDLNLRVELPMEFVSNGGNNTFAFVEFIAQLLVNERGHLRRGDEQGSPIDLDGVPQEGEYAFVPGA
jgi:hypothetical protein